MKRFKIFALALALMAVFAAGPAQAALQDMWANVYGWSGGLNSDGSMKLTRITSGITFKVLQRNSSSAETLYYYNTPAMTSLTNPVTTTNFESATVCNDMVSFRVDPTDSTYDRYVDLIVVNTDGGFTAFVEDFDQYTHSIIIDQRPNVMHHGLIWFDATTTDETTTGIQFKKNSYIHDVWVEVVTAASAATIDVGFLSTGTSGDADGLRKAVLLTTTGYVKDTAVVTNGNSIDYTAASTYGALLVTAITGSDAVATGGGKSWIGHIIAGAESAILSYSQGSTSGDGYIHYWFSRGR